MFYFGCFSGRSGMLTVSQPIKFLKICEQTIFFLTEMKIHSSFTFRRFSFICFLCCFFFYISRLNSAVVLVGIKMIWSVQLLQCILGVDAVSVRKQHQAYTKPKMLINLKIPLYYSNTTLAIRCLMSLLKHYYYNQTEFSPALFNCKHMAVLGCIYLHFRNRVHTKITFPP